MRLRIRDRLLWGLEISSGSRAYPAAKLFAWTPVGYSRRKYRDLLHRLIRIGQIQQLIIDGQVQLRLTGAGRELLLKNFPVLQLQGKTWDGFWRIVIFDIPESKRKQRDALRRALKKMGFGRLQDSSYISPHELSQPFLDWLQAKGLPGSVIILEAKQKHLGNPKNLAAKVWSLASLAGSYRHLIERLTTRFGIKEVKKREDWLKKIHQEYLQIILTEPLLPQELLPADWPAAKCLKFLLGAGVVKG
ncbi:MAG: CRISPR-associated endonuclease Cas2 [Patescibacteria group bacterium]|nr:CRISPR-associated endonuclease Cas2 [Patescibacteria group bacterium]